ncbi:MAG: VWA domain-containing protein [Bacteroidota bacterium]
MTDFGNKQYIYLFIVIPVMIVIFFLLLQWKKRALFRFAEAGVIAHLIPGRSVLKQVIRFAVYTTGIVLLIIGIMNPRIGTRTVEKKKEGIDIMIVLDISNSMKAEDIAPNRLECAKQAIVNLSGKLDGDRLGIVVFAGTPFLQLPITTDYGSAELFVDNIDTDLISAQGTEIGPALRMAARSFGEGSIGSKVIVLITDGETHDQDALDAAQEAAGKGIVVHCIGMATAKGAPIPVEDEYGNIVFKKDENGQTIVSKLDEGLLKNISAAGKGTYTRATNSESGLNTIMSRVRSMDQQESTVKSYSEYIDRFQVFLLWALILLTLELLMTDTVSPYIQKLLTWKKRSQS